VEEPQVGAGAGSPREPVFEVPLADDPTGTLYAERLRDGRIAVGTRRRGADGEWVPGELHLLEPGAYLALAGWLAPAVEDAWSGTLEEHRTDQLRTAFELYGESTGAAERLAQDMLGELPPALLARALVLLINSIGPDARARLVARLNRTSHPAEEAALRRQLAQEQDAFAYGVAAAALFDALERGSTSEPDPPAGW
jgi:hypothetical protein